MAKKRATEDKAVRSAANKSPAERIAQAERESASFEGDPYDGAHKTSVCYNPACPDYRRERRGSEACGCRKTAIG